MVDKLVPLTVSFTYAGVTLLPPPPPRVERGHSLEALMKLGDGPAPGDTTDGE